MSYIRSTSNLEGLYIWGDGKDANISKGGDLDRIRKIPQRIFDGLCKKYYKSFGANTKYKGASVKEIFVKSGKKQTKLEKMLGIEDGEFQTRLSYKDWYIDMWRVTWEYIARRYR